MQLETLENTHFATAHTCFAPQRTVSPTCLPRPASSSRWAPSAIVTYCIYCTSGLHTCQCQVETRHSSAIHPPTSAGKHWLCPQDFKQTSYEAATQLTAHRSKKPSISSNPPALGSLPSQDKVSGSGVAKETSLHACLREVVLFELTEAGRPTHWEWQHSLAEVLDSVSGEAACIHHSLLPAWGCNAIICVEFMTDCLEQTLPPQSAFVRVFIS